MRIFNLLKRINNRLKYEYLVFKILLFKINKNNVFFVYTPEHGNLGDHAIAASTHKLLRDLKYNYLEITFNELVTLSDHNLLGIFNKMPVIINGGGNLGTLWMNCENLTRNIINNNPDSKIIIMPNSIFYEENNWGQEELRKSIEIYNNHKNLKIYAREKLSYDFMKDIYKNVYLYPDMVFYLNESKNTDREKNCLLCLRSDCEKTVSENNQIMIETEIKNLFGNNYKYTDTVINRVVTKENRLNELNRKFDEFRKAGLVITDRLHGYLFCLITGTPCIIINSKSPKIKGCYEWIKDCEYIKFSENIEDIPNLWNELKDKKYIYDNKMFLYHYEKLKKDIIEFIREK